MKAILDRVFGNRSTLKRETVILCWIWISAMLYQTLFGIPPEHIRNYDTVIEGLIWPILALLAAIFGLQLVPMMSNRTTTETVTVATPGDQPDRQVKKEITTAPSAIDPVGTD